MAEYSIANHIVNKAAFAWWVPTLLRKGDRVLAKVKSKYWQQTHKYGIRIPKSVKEALAIVIKPRETHYGGTPSERK